MEDGLSGARRAVEKESRDVQRLRDEIDEHRGQTVTWSDRARDAVTSGDETAARNALLRKREHENLLEGLERELQAATTNLQHFTTTLGALEARLNDARRRQSGLSGEPAPAEPESTDPTSSDDIEAELGRAQTRTRSDVIPQREPAAGSFNRVPGGPRCATSKTHGPAHGQRRSAARWARG